MKPLRLLTLGFAAALAPTGAAADDFQTRANHVRDGYANSWYYNRPNTNVADSQTEWRKGIFYAAEAAFAAGNFAVGVSHANQGLNDSYGGDMFYMVALADLWARFPERFNPTPGANQVDSDLVRARFQVICWPTVSSGAGQTQNHRIMYETVRLIIADDPFLSQLTPSTTNCPGNALNGDAGASWLRTFMTDMTLSGRLGEADSATYLPYYLVSLRLLADKHISSDPDRSDIAQRAGIAFDWMVATVATEYNNGDFTGTSSRQYYGVDGSSYRPVQLGVYLWVLFGGKQPSNNTPSSSKLWDTIKIFNYSFRKPTGGPSVPLALTTYRPNPAIVEAATDRSRDYTSRERRGVNSANGYMTRYSKAGAFDLATAIQPPGGWGNAHPFDMNLHWTSSSTAARTLTLLTPDENKFPSLGVPQKSTNATQWLQDRGAAVAVISGASDPALVRGIITNDALDTNWASTRDGGSDNGWHVFAVDNAYVGVRSANSLVQNTTGEPPYNNVAYETSFVSDGGTNVLVVEAAPKTQYATKANFLTAIKARVFSCTGAITGCMPAAAGTIVSVTYQTLAGTTLSITWPTGGGTPVRTINGQVQDYSSWPYVDNPWARQEITDDFLRISGGGQTRVYRFGSSAWSTAVSTLLPGGDMESGTASTVTNWTKADWSGTTTLARTTSPAKRGTYAARINATSTALGGLLLNAAQRPTPTVGKRHTVTAWLKTDNVSAASGDGAYLQVNYLDSVGVVGTIGRSLALTGTNDWTSRSVTLPAAPANAAKIYISVRLKGTGVAHVDDVDMTTHD